MKMKIRDIIIRKIKGVPSNKSIVPDIKEHTNDKPLADDEELSALGDFLRGRSYSFQQGFSEAVMNKIRARSLKTSQNLQESFTIQLSNLFRWVAPIGSFAILVLLISLFLTQGAISFSSITGIDDLSFNDIITLSFYN